MKSGDEKRGCGSQIPNLRISGVNWPWIRFDMQLISESNQKYPIGAAAAFETLGAVNSPLSMVRTKDFVSSCICEA